MMGLNARVASEVQTAQSVMVMGKQMSSDFNQEVKSTMRDQKAKDRKMADDTLHYEMGVNAAWRGDAVDAMPKFKKQNRAASWLKGHADGLLAYQQHKERVQVDKPGLRRLCDVMRDALAKAQGV